MMLRANIILVFFQFSYLTSTFPIHQDQARSYKDLMPRNVAGSLQELNNEFKGIHWDSAFNGGENDCTPEQLDKLIYATRASMWMLERPIADGIFITQ